MTEAEKRAIEYAGWLFYVPRGRVMVTAVLMTILATSLFAFYVRWSWLLVVPFFFLFYGWVENRLKRPQNFLLGDLTRVRKQFPVSEATAWARIEQILAEKGMPYEGKRPYIDLDTLTVSIIAAGEESLIQLYPAIGANLLLIGALTARIDAGLSDVID